MLRGVQLSQLHLLPIYCASRCCHRNITTDNKNKGTEKGNMKGGFTVEAISDEAVVFLTVFVISFADVASFTLCHFSSDFMSSACLLLVCARTLTAV